MLNPNIAGRIRLEKIGLSDRAATITEAIEARFSLRVLAHTEFEPISLVPLDEYWTGKRLDFVKIDVDGHDTSVVRGAKNTLRRFRPVVMAEFCNRELLRYGSSIEALAAAFDDAGYTECEVIGLGEQMSLAAFLRSHLAAEPRNLLLRPP